MKLAALALGLGGLAGAWWAWWSVWQHIPLAFRWAFEVYVEPFLILGAACFVSIVIWEHLKEH